MRALVLCLLALGLLACGEDRATEPAPDDVAAEIERQLEENRESLPNDSATEAPVRRRSLERFVRDYQGVGFFAGEAPAAAARRIARAYEREWGEPARVATRLDELALLAYDRDRAWFSDIERDVLPGNDEYVAAFREWSRISAGAFEPRGVRERWRGEDGPVTITFRLDGRPRRVRAAAQGDFLDLCVLTAGINPLIESSRRQFAIYRPDAALGQSAFVVAVTRRERRRLEGMGWTFATREEVRLAFGYGQLAEAGEPAPC